MEHLRIFSINQEMQKDAFMAGAAGVICKNSISYHVEEATLNGKGQSI